MKSTTGRYVTTTVAGEKVRAFIPHPLPPRNPPLQMDAQTAEALAAATASLERLALAAEIVPSGSWLVYAFASNPTAAKAIGALVNAGILVETTGRRRDRLFSYAAYLELLRERM
jgi:hypothetical protein